MPYFTIIYQNKHNNSPLNRSDMDIIGPHSLPRDLNVIPASQAIF